MKSFSVFENDYIFPPLKFYNKSKFFSSFLSEEIFTNREKEKKIHLYIHIPFCRSICSFCYCRKFLFSKYYFQKYVIFLKEVLGKINGYSIKSLYFGGGTPSILQIEYLKDLIKSLKENNDFSGLVQFNFEVMPETVKKEYIEELINLGVNRLTFGVQSFDDKILSSLGRVSNFENTLDLLYFVKEIKAKNNKDIVVNIDLINLLPNDKVSTFMSGLQNLLKNDLVDTINLYKFTFTENVNLFEKKFYNSKNLDKNLGILDLYLKKFFKKKWFTSYYNDDKQLNYQIYRKQVWLEDILGIGLFARGNIYGKSNYYINFNREYYGGKDTQIRDFSKLKVYYFSSEGNLNWEKMRYFVYNIRHGIDDNIYKKIFGVSFIYEFGRFITNNLDYLQFTKGKIYLKNPFYKNEVCNNFFSYLKLKF